MNHLYAEIEQNGFCILPSLFVRDEMERLTSSIENSSIGEDMYSALSSNPLSRHDLRLIFPAFLCL
jgi:hypothetical protein